MAIRVRFDKNGFYHPAYGRLGRGKNEGRVYVLPDAFGETEEVKIAIMNPSHKPPIPTGEYKTRKRFKLLPSTAEIISQDEVKELQELAEEGDEEAKEQLEEIKQALAPKVATPEHLERVTGGPRKGKAQDATERTTGTSRRRSRKAAPAA